MNKLEQAARQALDALEDAYENGFLTGITGLKTIDVITALREALAEQAEQEPVAYKYKESSPETGEFIFSKQAEQEHDGHWSDCSVHNEPAYPNGPCDCGGYPPKHWRCACGANLYIDSNGAPASKAEQVKQEDKDLVAQMNIDVGLKQKVYEALAEQAEQEPVAWLWVNEHGSKRLEWEPVEDTSKWKSTPLYAAPVRTKDLTDDELNALWHGNTEGGWLGLFRAVIAADREKNK